jgi:hypothetical protein
MRRESTHINKIWNEKGEITNIGILCDYSFPIFFKSSSSSSQHLKVTGFHYSVLSLLFCHCTDSSCVVSLSSVVKYYHLWAVDWKSYNSFIYTKNKQYILSSKIMSDCQICVSDCSQWSSFS